MSKSYVIVFDIGTQSTRCMLISNEGEIVAQAKSKYDKPYYSLKLGYAEQSFDYYYEHFKKVSLEVKEKAKDLWDKALAVSFTTIRDTFTTVDKDGKPTRDFILWLDNRRANTDKPLPPLQTILFKLVGMEYCVKQQRLLCRQAWIKQNEEEIWSKSDKFASLGAIFNKKLTNNLYEVEASCIGHVPHDYKKGGWLNKRELTYPIYDLNPDKLPELKDTLSVIGNVTLECSLETGLKVGLPVIGSAADKACELAGSGVKDDKAAELAFGTSVSIEYLTDKYIEPDPFMPAYPSLNPKKFISEVQIYRGCWMISWFIENFCTKEEKEAIEKGVSTEEILDSHLKDAPIGSQGLVLLPYWNPPLTNPELRGTIMGFLPDHNKYHIYRAILEGIGYTLYENYLKLEKRTKQNIDYFVISGGGSSSDEICQMMSDILGKEIRKPKEFESTSLGCALGTFVACGVYKSFEEATEKMISYKKTFKPNEENHKLYMEVYNKIYKNILKKVSPVYKGYYKLPE